MTKILVIEDEAPLLDEILDTLEFEDFEVIGAENGSVGVQLAKQHLPDLIISDIMMPVMDGYSVLLELRSDPTTATIPFVFLTAKAGRADMRRGMEYGANDYLTKPFTHEELLGTVTARLKEHELLSQRYSQKIDDLRYSLMHTLPHELRTPLVSILGFAELLALDYETLTPEHIYTMGSTILRGGKRLYRLIENYLLFAQIELLSGDQAKIDTLRGDQIKNPRDIVEQIMEDKTLLYERDSEITLQIDDAAISISDTNFAKIADELIDNAFKFSENGTLIQVTGGMREGHYLLTVEDRGRGMSPEHIKEIGAYMQFDRTVAEQQGSGLGLIIARRLAELHGGQLVVESVPGEGTIVYVSIPASNT